MSLYNISANTKAIMHSRPDIKGRITLQSIEVSINHVMLFDELSQNGPNDKEFQYRTRTVGPRIEMLIPEKNGSSTTLSCNIGPMLRKYSATGSENVSP